MRGGADGIPARCSPLQLFSAEERSEGQGVNRSARTRAFEVALRDLADNATARTWLLDRQNWYAAILLGLISSTYSTLISQFAAGRFGRDAVVDWMTVAAIPARDWVVHAEP